jgi:hypothetical protein
MAWPSTVAPHQAASAAQYNGIVLALQTWQGDVSAGGHKLTNCGGITLAANAVLDVSAGGFNIKGGLHTTTDGNNIGLTVTSSDAARTLQMYVPPAGATPAGTAMVSSNGQFVLRTPDTSRGVVFSFVAGAEEYISSNSGRLRLANSVDVDVDLVAGGKLQGASLNISNPANITLGANFVNWTPVITPNAPMTLVSTSLEHAYYLRIGPVVFFSFGMVLVFGGTAAAGFSVSLPLAALDSFSHVCSGLIFQNALLNISSAQQSGAAVNIFSNTALALGVNTSVRVEGFYKVA